MNDPAMRASHQWATRPHDQRFLSLLDLATFKRDVRENSRSFTMPSSKVQVMPGEGRKELLLAGLSSYCPDVNDAAATPSNWSFGQLCQLGAAPAAFLRDQPASMAALNLEWALKAHRETEEVGMMVTRVGKDDPNNYVLSAATGPRYGRVWDEIVAAALIEKFGDGVTGDWKVPGEFGQDVPITKENTTLYASDRDMFVFLADEKNRIEVPDRRNGKPGSVARGFFVWNSEVGSSSLGGAFFLFDYVCCNRIVWGMQDFTEIRIRHTSGAPDRWLDEVVPVLEDYSQRSSRPVIEVIEAAKSKRIDDVEKLLTERFGRRIAADMVTIHDAEEHHPVETIWDATTAATAYARSIPFVDQRVAVEREAGKLLQLAA